MRINDILYQMQLWENLSTLLKNFNSQIDCHIFQRNTLAVFSRASVGTLTLNLVVTERID